VRQRLTVAHHDLIGERRGSFQEGRILPVGEL
jgi:hypothetical protein